MRQLSILVVGLFVITYSISYAMTPNAAKHVSPEKAKYKEVTPGISKDAQVSKAFLWGEPNKGAHGAFTRIVRGFEVGKHVNSCDVWLVVQKGAYLYKDNEGERRVLPGEFLWIPAGLEHWSGSDKEEGALLYEESSCKFDASDPIP